MKIRLTIKQTALLSVAVICILCAAVYVNHSTTASSKLTVSQSAALKLPKRAPNLPTMYLAKGLLPPTNKWFSSLVFSTSPEPVYAYPLSFELTATGYSLSNPPLVSSTNAIFASHIADISVNMQTPRHIVDAYDDLSVSVAQQFSSGQTVVDTRITHGSPYIFSTFHSPDNVTISTPGVITATSAQTFIISVGGRLYGLYTTAQTRHSNGTIAINAQKGSELTVFTLPGMSQAAVYFADASHVITSTAVSYRVTNTSITTNYTINTTSGKTLFASTPSMHINGHPSYGSFTTLLGKQIVLGGNTFSDIEPAITMPSPELNLKSLTPNERSNLIQQLTTDTDSLTFSQTDTYFGGKELYRAANLLEIAEELHQLQLADSIKTKLADRLSEWLNPNGWKSRSDLYFYYDTAYHGVVGVNASYGSNMFNDHDFHYGYFIYASAILSQYDHPFYTQNAAMVDVLISDIASTQTTSLFPKLRYFDPYVGHSWASGNGDFSDGNNQESSSEAINAWYAMYLWSQVSHNPALASESEWLYSHETLAAQTMWLSVNDPATFGPMYAHPTAGIIWGDKIDYSTFFSPSNLAILGIQLIPMSPGQAYLAKTNVNQNIDSVAPTASSLVGQFQDYLIMYQALSNPQLALQEAKQLTPQDLDNADSMTYFYAWLYSHQ